MGLLRFILAISVVLSHTGDLFGFTFVGGQLAVQAFYIISGFYMTLILNEKYIGKNSSYKLFISNRLLRLYPIYWTVLILTILYSLINGIYTQGKSLDDLSFPDLSYLIHYYNELNIGSLIFLVFTNIFLFLQDTVMFLGLNLQSGNLFFTPNFGETSPMLFNFLIVPQAWTIGVEIAFYLIAPFLVRRKLKVIIPLILASILLRIFLFYKLGLNHDPWLYRFFPTELAFFLLGIVAYHIYKRIENININKNINLLIWIFVLILVLGFNYLHAIPNISIIFLIVFFLALPFIFLLTKRWKRDSFIGEFSYPIYISHVFVIKCLNTMDFRLFSHWSKPLSVTLVTIVISFLLTQFVTKKIETIRVKRLIKQ